MIEKLGHGLKYPPLKGKVNKKLPEYLFWEHKDCFDTWDITMFSTKDTSKYGKMSLIKTTQSINNKTKPYILVLMFMYKISAGETDAKADFIYVQTHNLPPKKHLIFFIANTE